MTLKFTPPANAARYAFACGDKFTTYNSLGHAKAAYHHLGYYIGKSNPAYVLERVGGDWFVLYEVPPGTEREQVPWYGDKYYGWQNRRHYGLEKYRRAIPMTREQYAEWRLAVEAERSAGAVPGRPTPGAGIERDDEDDARRLQEAFIRSRSGDGYDG